MDERERHRHACKLFVALADCAEADRRARLAEISNNDPELAKCVEAMLSADDDVESTGDDLCRAVAVVAEERLGGLEIPDPLIGTSLGHYLIVRPLAVGGMGRVYEARQESPARSVALKILDSRIASRAALTRFRHEAELMARLVHPGIAQIYEAGTQREMPGTLPWFAMELIPNATSIVDAARQRGLSVGERIEMFIDVCDAVHFGHGCCVVHRDLKPSNILVDGGAPVLSPKIIDFGIARSIDSDVTIATQRTETGQIVGTLQYMSPEQLEGNVEAIDVRSDVYALGLILHELLTDFAAFDVAGLALPQALRVLAESTPRRMVDVAPLARRRLLADDLQTIVSKAADRDPARRYQSVAEFAQDLRRFMANEPISARPASALYTVRLFSRRHRGLVWGAVATVLTLFLGLAGTSIGLLSALHSERDAESARDGAEYEAYVANLIAAEAALRTNDVRLARERLEAASERYRGWEWRHLLARSDRSIVSVETGLFRSASIALSPDGALVVAGDLTGAVCAYNTESLQPTWKAKGPSEVRGIRFSDDGRFVSIAFDNREVQVMSTDSGTVTARRPFAGPRWAAFGPDAMTLEVVESTLATTIWRTDDDSLVSKQNEESTAESRRYELLDWSPDRAWIATNDDEGVIARRLLDGSVVGIAARASRVESMPRWSRSAAFSNDSTRMAAIAGDGAIALMTLGDGRSRAGQAMQSPVKRLAWLFDDSVIMAASLSGAITLHDPTTLHEQQRLLGHEVPVAAITSSAQSPHGPIIASLDWSGVLRLWSPSTQDIYRHTTNRAWVYGVAFALDGSWFVTAAGESPEGDPAVASFETLSGERRWSAPAAPRGTITFSVDVNFDGTRLVHDGAGDVGCVVRDATSGNVLAEERRSEAQRYFLGASFRRQHNELFRNVATGRALLSADGSTTLRSFHVESCNERCQDRSGTTLILTSRPGSAFVAFDVESGAEIAQVDTPTAIWSIDFSHDGQHVAARLETGDIWLWETKTWTLVRSWPGDGYGGGTVRFEPGGRLLGIVVGGLRVWDIERGRELLTLPIASEICSPIGVSSDGSCVGVGGVDGTTWIFDAPLQR